MNTSKKEHNNQSAVSERRKHQRVSIMATFCIFVTKGNEAPSENTPFISAGLYDISLGGAQFSCESMTACSPFCDTERKISKDATLWMIPNGPAENVSSCSSGCSCSSGSDVSAEKISLLGDDPIEAKVMWVSNNRFGCMFIDPDGGFTKALEKIIDDMLRDSGIEFQ